MSTARNRNPVNWWLYSCCGMIFVMALLGAITRLTESGLSITDWRPITGALPPLNDAAWQKAFAAYQQIPQYQLNRGMSLADFQHIYFWEWLHRLWGRLIGLVFFLPLFGFFLAKKISRGFFLRLLAIFALGGLQGFIGWFMVQSGLETRTSVSPYRLALHLGFALLLYGLILWVALGNREKTETVQSRASLRWHGWLCLGFLAVTIIWGALVAGMRAGTIYNTWPLMGGGLLPPEAATPSYFESAAWVQFTHRWLGPTTFLLLLSWIARCWRMADAPKKIRLKALGLMALAQVGLGIGTLLSQVQIAAAVTHQAGAIVLLSLLLVNFRSFSPGRA